MKYITIPIRTYINNYLPINYFLRDDNGIVRDEITMHYNQDKQAYQFGFINEAEATYFSLKWSE